MRRLALTLGLVLASLFIAEGAHANGRIPEANQLVVLPSDPDYLVLRTSFGVLVSADRGKTWDWICETAYGIDPKGSEDPSVGLVQGRTIVAGTFNGLRTTSGGCSWPLNVDLGTTFVVDVATEATASNIVALSNKGVQDGGYDSHLFRSVDGAKSWGSLFTFDPTLVLDTVEVARSNPARIYVTAKKFGAQTEFFFLASSDGGKSFQSYPVAVDTGENGSYVCGVDPQNPDRVYVRTLAFDKKGVVGSRLLVSDDAGKTFVERWRGGPLLGFSLSQDGTKAYLGAYPGGLAVLDTQTFVATQRQSYPIKCLTTVLDRLYACTDKFNGGFILGVSTDDATSFTPVFQLTDVRGPLSCASATDTAKCNAEWPQLKATLGIDAGEDAGTPPPVTPPPAASGCGCTTTNVEGAGAGALASFAVALAIVMRRRRR